MLEKHYGKEVDALSRSYVHITRSRQMGVAPLDVRDTPEKTDYAAVYRDEKNQLAQYFILVKSLDK
jgi:hypothetical protein